MAYSVYEEALKSGQSTYRPIDANSLSTSQPSTNVLPIPKIQYQESPGAGAFVGSAIGETLRKGAIGGLGILKSLFRAPIEATTTIQRMFNTPTINPLLIKRADEITAATKQLQKMSKDDPSYQANLDKIKLESAKLQSAVEKQTNPLINTSPTKFLGQIGETALMALPAGELNAVRGSTLFGKGVSASGRLKAALPLAARGAGIGAGFGVTQTMQQDDPNLKDLGKNVAVNAGIGAGAELLAPLLFKRVGGKPSLQPMSINPPLDSRVRNQFQKNLWMQLEPNHPDAAKLIKEANFDDAVSTVDLARKALDILPDNVKSSDVKQAINAWAKSGEQTVGFLEHGIEPDDALGVMSKDLPTTKPSQTTIPQMGSVLQKLFGEKKFEPEFLKDMTSREARKILSTVGKKSEKLQTLQSEISGLSQAKLTERLKAPAIEPETVTSGLKLSTKKVIKDNPDIKVGQKLEQQAKDEFFETSNPKEGLFITSDGKYIDGTGKNQVGESERQYMNDRIVDHREVASFVGEDLQDYMTKTGNVRYNLSGSTLYIDTTRPMNPKQLSALKKAWNNRDVDTIVADISDAKGDAIQSGEFDNFDDFKNWQSKYFESNPSAELPAKITNTIVKEKEIPAIPKSFLKIIESRQPTDSTQVKKLDRLLTTRTKTANALKEEIEAMKNSTAYKNMVKAKNLKLESFEDTVSTRNIIVDPEDAVNLTKVQDLKPREVGYLTTIDPIRAAEKGDRSLRGILKRRFIEPLMAARDRQMTEFQKIKNTFDTIADEAGVKPVKGLSKMLGLQAKREERNALIFRAAEGRLDAPIDNVLTKPEQRLIEYTRGKYDELLDRINAVRAKVNLEPVKKRKEYITHIQALNFLENMGRDASKISDSELLQFLDRKSPAFQFAKERKGGAFEEDLTQAFNAYLEPALRQIHFTEIGNSILADAKFLPKNQQRYWKDFVRERVFGSMDDLSAYANKVIHPSFSRVTQALRRITGRGAILGNIQTIALQPSSIAQVYGTAGGKALLRSTPKMLSEEGTAFVEKFSALYRQRAQELDINPNSLTKAQNVLNYANKELDQFMVKTAWLSSYEQATRQFGLNHEAAVRYAENMAGKTQAIYDKMFSSRMAGSKVGGVLAQFQTYSFNLYNQLTRDLKVTASTFGSKKPALKQAMKLAIGMFAVNQLYKGAGMQSPFDLPSFNTEKYSGERKKGVGIIPAAIHSTSPGTILPYSGTAKYGAPIAIDLLYNLFKLPIVMTDDAERTKTLHELGKTVPMLVPGGNQIRKTTEGIQAVLDGYTTVGKKKIPIKGTSEEIRAILFGKYGTKATRDYFNNQ